MVHIYMSFTVMRFNCRALEGHTNGDLPWAWCDECLQDDMGKVVGKWKETEMLIILVIYIMYIHQLCPLHFSHRFRFR